MNKEEEDFIEIDEQTIIDVKRGIVKYTCVFVVFVFLPLLMSILAGRSFSKLNVFVGFVGLTFVCVEQVSELVKFLLSLQIVQDSEESEINQKEEEMEDE